MFKRPRQENFCGFDDINHKSLYRRHLNLKNTKHHLFRNKHYVKDACVYNKIFDRYDFYNKVSNRMYEITEMYRKQNINNGVDFLMKKYEEKMNNIIFCSKNGSRVQLSLRIVWNFVFLKEYFIFGISILKNKLSNGLRKGIRTN
ncbi:MAG TPA: hypothetical protein PK507_01425 [bacterium]|nr:hypothetical protein [bacterium]